MTKKQKLPKIYRETPEMRHQRVVAEGNRFRQRTVESKKVYNRKKNKKEKYYDDLN